MKLLLILTVVASLFTASCGTKVDSYTVDGSGRDWVSQPVQTLPAEKVTPNVTVPLGDGSIVIPVQVKPAK